jgi:hypothetical protein
VKEVFFLSCSVVLLVSHWVPVCLCSCANLMSFSSCVQLTQSLNSFVRSQFVAIADRSEPVLVWRCSICLSRFWIESLSDSWQKFGSLVRSSFLSKIGKQFPGLHFRWPRFYIRCSHQIHFFFVFLLPGDGFGFVTGL